MWLKRFLHASSARLPSTSKTKRNNFDCALLLPNMSGDSSCLRPVGPEGVLRSLRLRNVLDDCGMLRASSDKTRVKVVRALPNTGEKREIVLNLEAASIT